MSLKNILVCALVIVSVLGGYCLLKNGFQKDERQTLLARNTNISTNSINSFVVLRNLKPNEIDTLKFVSIYQMKRKEFIFPEKSIPAVLSMLQNGIPQQVDRVGCLSIIIGEMLIKTSRRDFKIILYNTGARFDSYFWTTRFSKKLEQLVPAAQRAYPDEGVGD